jgi:hypothetical protein
VNRLLAVYVPAQVIDDLIVISVELWTNAVFVHFARVETEETDRLTAEHVAAIAAWRQTEEFPQGFPEQPGADIGADLTLADDAGTRYRMLSGRAGGSGEEWRGALRFEPRVPEQASRLTIATGGNEMELEL